MKTPEPPLVWHTEHDHPRPLLRWKPPVVEIVAIERDQGAPELAGQPEVLDVAALKILDMALAESAPALEWPIQSKVNRLLNFLRLI